MGRESGKELVGVWGNGLGRGDGDVGRGWEKGGGWDVAVSDSASSKVINLTLLQSLSERVLF